ncbi:MAG: bifunctional diaminohydroxyphosphoribosylaminopyrimidine deaminase/5-amino-6-(5-phosphoribosylamino)uracil reductase RibD [Candidatus Gracilibacteria bacterium]|nr:bifunctional diaminohydroxyphosphoribosylaminopyrimidine deaminase/5-amino-6-(5-phosphoribosylamino)uracil reductase RibD [Candidatus Gracilibacteria bacterium]
MNEKFMQRAFDLAFRGKGFTSPNPSVGAVIVSNGSVIGEGWHKKAGGAHAEVFAIKSVKNKNLLIGSDLYVTLEPCCHFGKTPPCTSAIIESGIKNVFVGMKDPFLKVSGKGILILKKAGVKVEVLRSGSALFEKIKDLNQPFLKYVKTGLPYLTMKAGISIDGKIAAVNGKSKWITGEKARLDGRMERSFCDAVIVGSKTVEIDNPELNCVGRFQYKNILKVIIDRDLNLDPKKKIFRSEKVLLVCSKKVSLSRISIFEEIGVEVRSFGENGVDLTALLRFLSKKGIQSVFVEGGSKTHGGFYDLFLKNSKVLDRVIFYIAPFIMGGGEKSLSVVGGKGVLNLNSIKKLHDVKVDFIAKDLKYTAILNRY